MTFFKQIGGAAMVIGAGLSAPPAQAGYIVDLTQVGANVVATGSGSIDLTGLTFALHGDVGPVIEPSLGFIQAGPVSILTTDDYTGFAGPANFGSGGFLHASNGTGDLVGIVGGANLLLVPSGYVSGTALSDTATWNGQTFASLGATPGTYVWT